MPGLLNIPEAMSIALHTCLWIADGDARSAPRPKSRRTSASPTTISPRSSSGWSARACSKPNAAPRAASASPATPKTISMLEIYEAAGGEPLRPHRCLLDPKICAGRACALGHLIESENERLHKTMKQTTLAGLARSFDKTQLRTA
jgi:hypothetical protein